MKHQPGSKASPSALQNRQVDALGANCEHPVAIPHAEGGPEEAARRIPVTIHMDPIVQQAPFIIRADEARIYNMRFGQARILVDGKRSGGTCWMGEFRQDPGFATPLHLHPKTDEYLFVIDGVLSLYIAGEWQDLETGSLAVVPHGARHAQCNAGKQPLRILGLGGPAGFEGFFPAQHELLDRVSPSDPRFFSDLAKILSAYDTEVVAPPPARL